MQKEAESPHYIPTVLQEEITIQQLYTVHYFEYAKGYLFQGESHNFWEFLYVDKGEVEVMAGASGYKLQQGQLIFHPPMEFHNVWANGRTAPNLIVVSFSCTDASESVMEFFRQTPILQIGNTEKNLLAGILREARAAFSSPLHDPYLAGLERRAEPRFAAEQMLRLYLELLLLTFLRRGKHADAHQELSSSVRERFQNDLVKKVISFMQENLCRALTFEEIREHSMQSATALKVLFKEATGQGLMEYFQHLKMEEAKRLIREGNHNFTQIAEILGYSSIHYFSRTFKKVTCMTPSQYALSVKIKI